MYRKRNRSVYMWNEGDVDYGIVSLKRRLIHSRSPSGARRRERDKLAESTREDCNIHLMRGLLNSNQLSSTENGSRKKETKNVWASNAKSCKKEQP